MDARQRLETWREEIASGRAKAALVARARRLGDRWRVMRRAAVRTGRAAGARAGSEAAKVLAAARWHLESWRCRLAARWRESDLPDSAAAAMRQAGTAVAQAGERLGAAVSRSCAGMATGLRQAGRRIGALPLVERARRGFARTSAWLRTGPLQPFVARIDAWLAQRRREAEGRYRIEVATPQSRYVAIGGTALLALLVALPAFAGRDVLHDLIFVFTMLALAQCWNLLAGYAGLVSVGQQAFVGLGGYLLFALTIHAGLDPLLAILVCGLLAGVLAFPTALVVFRLRGAYFVIGTWVMAEVYRLVFAQFKQLGGGTGTSLPPFVTNEVAGIEWVKALFGVRTSAARDIITYWTALGLAAATILLVYLILRSRHGLALAAIRDSETAAESVGVDNFKTKLKVYVVTAVATGMVGALIYLQKARISPDAAFSVLDWTAYVIFIVVIGGIATIEGPIVGVLVFYVLQTNLAHFGSWYLILLGLFAILTMLFAPKGLWGLLSERYGLTVFPIRRRLVANRTGESEEGARERPTGSAA
jgi:branched-chain amino acid transport system permease protein